MSDGRVSIAVDVDGKAVNGLNGQLDQLEGKSHKASGGIKTIVTSLGLMKLASAAFDVLRSSMDAAISRFDTMNKFPKVMDALGFSAKDSSVAVNKLAAGIDGLPTKLDDVVSTAQRMTAITGNMNKSTDATIGLNNAMLASGASASDASRGLDQYVQMLSTGQVDLQSWKTLQETMPIGLQKVAEAMGFVGKTAQRDLYSALKDGTVTFDQFQDKLIELGTGTGELAKLARVNSEGIATSFGNLGNAVSKGLANVMTALDKLSKEVSGKSIAGNFDSLKVVINASFTSMTKVIDASTPAVKLFVSALGAVLSTAKPLTPVLTGLATAYGAFKILRSINSLFTGTNAIFQMVGFSGKALTLTTQAHMAAQVADTSATKADILAKGAQNGAVTLSTLLIGVLSGGVSAHTVVTTLATTATVAFKAAIDLLCSGLGIVVGVIGILVTAGIALWKWFNKESDGVKELRGEQEELIKSTEALVSVNEEAVQARKDEVESLAASKSNYKSLIDEMDMLTSKEKLSNSEKKRAGEIVEELNAKLGNLNLVYDEQTNKLSEQPEKIQQQIDAYTALDEASSAQERINEMLKQRNDNEAKLMEINIARERWNETLQKSSGNTKEAKENIEQLDLKEKELQTTQSDLTTEILNTATAHEESMQRATAAVESGVMEQTISYDALQGKNKEVMDALRSEYQSLEEKVGSAFDVITQKQAISVDQMAENLQKNQEAVSQWGQNIEALAERHVDQGLLEQLRKMGPEGAAQAAVLVNSSQEELDKLNEVFRQTGETSMNAMKDAYELGKYGVNDEIALIIPSQKETLVNQLAQANFGDIGKSATDDLKAGVENGRNAVAEATKGIVAESESSIKSEMQKANFKGIGSAIPEGMGNGIIGKKEEPIKATLDMSTSIIDDGAKKPLNVNSPSKVFHEIGNNIIEGLSNGIEQQSASPVQALKLITEQLIESMNGIADRMQSLGQFAMMGLANGIYSGSSAALSAAQSVANSITRTIQSALDIHSPSRVMRDQIGRHIPSGIAVGIEANSDSVYKAMESLSGGINASLSPESALGINSGLFGNVSKVSNNYYDTKPVKNNREKPIVNINIEHADMSNDKGIEETSRQLGILAQRELRGNLS